MQSCYRLFSVDSAQYAQLYVEAVPTSDCGRGLYACQPAQDLGFGASSGFSLGSSLCLLHSANLRTGVAMSKGVSKGTPLVPSQHSCTRASLNVGHSASQYVAQVQYIGGVLDKGCCTAKQAVTQSVFLPSLCSDDLSVRGST